MISFIPKSAIFFGILSLAILLGLSGCATQQPLNRFPVTQPDRSESPASMDKFRAQNYFVLARDIERRGYPAVAQRFYEYAHRLDPKSGILRMILAQQYLQSDKINDALLLIKGKRTLAELTDDERRMAATIYIRLKQRDQAALALESIKNRTESDIYMLGLLYEAAGRSATAYTLLSGAVKDKKYSLETGLKIAQLFISQRKIALAESLLVSVAQTYGDSPRILFALGQAKEAAADTASAIGCYTMAIAGDSTFLDPVRQLGQIYLGREDYAKAVGYFARLIQDPDIGETYLPTCAMLYYYQRQYALSRALFERILASDIDNGEYHYLLGMVTLAQGDTAVARLEREKAYALADTVADSWRQLGLIAIQQKNWSLAVETGTRFAKAVSRSAAPWRLVGYAYSMEKKYRNAAGALSEAVKRDSTDSHIWFELGSAYERGALLDRSAYAFGRVLRLLPGDPVASNYLGYMWADAGVHLDSAALLIRQALAKDSANGAYLDSYAWVLYKKGDLTSALRYIRAAAQSLQNDPVVYRHMGEILAKMDQCENAILSYKTCLTLEPEDRDAVSVIIRELEKQCLPVHDRTMDEKGRK